MKRRLSAGCVSILFTWISGAQALSPYQIVDLGVLPGATRSTSSASAINNQGQIVGTSYSSTGYSHATLFDASGAGNHIDLGTLGGRCSSALSINENGQIVGVADTIAYSGHATLFNSAGTGNNINLGTLMVYVYQYFSAAYEINNLGQVIGTADSRDGGRATLFDVEHWGNNNTDLGTIGGDYSAAMAINDNGQIVGSAYDSTNHHHFATLFDSSGEEENINLGTIPGGNDSEAMSINNQGQIVGWAYGNSSNKHAVLFDPTGSGNNVFLGNPNEYESFAGTINNLGQIVGWTCMTNNAYRATLFDPTGAGNNIDLNSLLPEGSGWTLTVAADINANGWIIGQGKNPDGEYHAFLLKPVPEPATVSLLLLGGMGMIRRKRR